MRKTMALAVVVAAAGALTTTALRATPGYGGFTPTTISHGTFAPMNLKNKQSGKTIAGVEWEWEAQLRTEGATELFIQDNTWPSGASTGWHTHPGFSLVTVTAGTLTVYDGDDPQCASRTYTVGDTFIDPTSNDSPHLIRNEDPDPAHVAKTTAVQLIPTALKDHRRKDLPRPATCTAE